MNKNFGCVTLSHSREPRIGVRGRHGNPDAHAFKKGNVTPFSSRLTVDNQTGFTLMEILVSIVVMSIIAVITGVGLVQISQGYVFSKKNAVTTQQGQIAMARLKKEISNIQLVTSSSASSITYRRCSDSSPPCGTLKDVTISWAGGSGPLLIDSDILVQPVTNFTIAYYDSYNGASSPSYSNTRSIIEITLQLIAAEGTVISITDRINLYQETGG